MTEEQPSRNVEPLQKIDVEYSADSVECCPLPGHEHIVLCGTYQLAPPSASSTDATPGDDEVSMVQKSVLHNIAFIMYIGLCYHF